MAIVDRVGGLRGELALKAPVRVATTANITLSGLQTIDGETLVADDRVLVKDQTDGSENGIYVAASGAWARAKDWDGSGDVVPGTRVSVTEGSVQQENTYQVTNTSAITIGTTVVTFSSATDNAASSAAAAATSATAAASSASAATTSATAAETAQTAAETAETNAETAETNAETAESNAASSASAAATSATAAAASATAAAASESAAAGYAAGLNLPAIQGGDSLKILRVKSDETGYEHANAGAGDLVSANNLSDVSDAATSRGNLGAQAQGTLLDAFNTLSTIAADKIIYSSALDTLATDDLTAYGRAIIGQSNETAFHQYVNLEPGVDVQPYHASLASIAGLTTDADKMIYATALNTYAVADLTSAGRALLDDADAAAQRATLGLDIGADVQAHNPILDDVAGLTQAADKGIYFDTSSTAATFDLTSAGRALLDDASATAQRATLGLGALATLATVATAQIDDESVTLAKIEHAAAYTLLMNTAGSTGDPSYTKISSVTDRTAFGSGDKLLIEESSGELRKVDYDDLPGSGGGISNVIEDITPQLGGMLDVNTFALGDGTLELLSFTETASAVNHINITNATTGNGATLGVAGDDTNIDLILAGEGTGVPKIGTNAILHAGDIGSSVQAHDADTLKADTADVLTAAFEGAVDDDGTKSSGTYTPSLAAGSNWKKCVNAGAFTLAPPVSTANDQAFTMKLLVVNTTGAGAITTSSFSIVTGDDFSTTTTDEFECDISVYDIGGTEYSHLHITALQ